ncbi:hypothetical protein [Sulfuriroseicoccus oceanibius]|uniref:Uncharacterized protein n=1 Tax=Sulfuriroseicoccus oceanibius TaxID=2707525 RepID=A0A6B3L848_9BACT|nr:hypothetical protein [Sulfuriroseicoccus oceanibius]QQL43913.1 hypothetical protein G3M56_008385 [Sulfuriroseicoccus oceanibius]
MLPLRSLISVAPLVCALGFHTAIAAEPEAQPAPPAAAQTAGSPVDVATRFVTSLAQEQSTAKQMVESGLILVSEFCPAEKQVRYRTSINEMRSQLKGAKVEPALTKSQTIGNFAYVVLTLTPEDSIDDVIITGFALARTTADQPWKVAIGVRHFNNTGTTLSPEALENSRKVLTAMMTTEREVRANQDAQELDTILTKIREARKALELDKSSAREVLMTALYPKKELTDYERLALFALDDEATIVELRASLEAARRVNILCSQNARPIERINQAQEDEAEPPTIVPWMPELLNERPHQAYGSTYFLAPQDVRRAMGSTLDPIVEIVAEKATDSGDEIAFAVGMFDSEYAGRFTSTPVYMVKKEDGWHLQFLSGSAIHRQPHAATAFTQPDRQLTRWAMTRAGETLDTFAASIWKRVQEAHPVDPEWTNTDVARKYLDAAIKHDVMLALSFFSDYIGEYGTSMTRATKAMKDSFDSLDPENFELFSTPDSPTDVIDDRVAITWLATIETKNPENLSMSPVITELHNDRWGVLPDIHSVAPLNEDNFPGMPKRVVQIDAEHNAALAKIDKHRTAEREDKINEYFDLLMNTPRIIGKLADGAPEPAAPDFATAQSLVGDTARRTSAAPLFDILESGAVFETQSNKVRFRFLTDIGNDRQLFKNMGEQLELVRVLHEGRWLGAIIRDASILERKEELESPSTKDTLSLRLFVSIDDQWVPVLGASFIKEENVGMKWINKQAVKAASLAIGRDEAAVFDAFIKQLNDTDVDTAVDTTID